MRSIQNSHQALGDKIVQCLERAAECRRVAESTTDARARADFLDMERRWIKLSESYLLAERISGWIAEIRRRTSAGGD